MAVQLLTKSAYARHRGCDEKAVRKAILEGRISSIDGKIDPEVADIQWARNTRARVPAGGAGGGGSGAGGSDLLNHAPEPSAPAGTPQAGVPPAADSGYVSLRARREAADAERAEIETAKLKGAMVMREDVDRGLFAIGREVRDHLSGCARRIASEVAGINTTEGCEAVIDREHRIVMELLVKLIREKVGAPVNTHQGAST